MKNLSHRLPNLELTYLLSELPQMEAPFYAVSGIGRW